MTPREARDYDRERSVVFRKTREQWGGLSNMAAGFPLLVNDTVIPTTEALYQACRFPSDPEIQRLIISERSPMTAKMKSKPYRETHCRGDWNRVRIPIMRWCLHVKLVQNWDDFHALLLATSNINIVEESRQDAFWGAIPDSKGHLRGANVLGRLLMELRNDLLRLDSHYLRAVAPLEIPNFYLLGQPIGPIMAVETPQSSKNDKTLPRQLPFDLG